MRYRVDLTDEAWSKIREQARYIVEEALAPLNAALCLVCLACSMIATAAIVVHGALWLFSEVGDGAAGFGSSILYTAGTKSCSGAGRDLYSGISLGPCRLSPLPVIHVGPRLLNASTSTLNRQVRSANCFDTFADTHARSPLA